MPKASWRQHAPLGRGVLQILSTQSSTAIEDVAKARGGSGLWYQLYTTNNWDVTTKVLRRAEAAGCPVVAVTVDLPAGRNTLTDRRMARVDTRECASCHGAVGPAADGRAAGVKPMFAGIDMKGVTLTSATLTWDFVKRAKDVTKMKVLVSHWKDSRTVPLEFDTAAIRLGRRHANFRSAQVDTDGDPLTASGGVMDRGPKGSSELSPLMYRTTDGRAR
jgi:hypothetical protein